MILITAYSDSLDGFAYLSKLSDKKEALEELKAKSQGYEVVVVDETTYFVKDSVPIEELEELDGEPPRWNGWSLHIGEVAENGFVNSDAVCW